MENGIGDGDLESDIVSDFGSTVTGSSQSSINSRTSHRTAKSRRKQERKRFSLREGSRFEEEGLLQALHELYTAFKTVQDEIHSLIFHMSLYYLDNEAAKLQKFFMSTFDIFEKTKSKIWVLPDADSTSSLNAQSTVNSIIASRSSIQNSPCSFEDLEVRVPPKFKVTDTGMRLYADKSLTC